jgi:hypothetical protein
MIRRMQAPRFNLIECRLQPLVDRIASARLWVGAGPPGRRARLGRPRHSDFGVLGEIEHIFDVDAEIANRALDLGVSEQDLNRSEIASGLVNYRHLRPPQRMRAVILAPKADGCYPLVHEPGKLPSADVFRSISSARKDIIIERATSAFQPVLEAGSGGSSSAARPSPLPAPGHH